MPHHSYDHGGTHWGLRIVMILALVVFPGLLGWVLVNITRQREVQRSEVSTPPPRLEWPHPLRILDERLARAKSGLTSTCT